MEDTAQLESWLSWFMKTGDTSDLNRRRYKPHVDCKHHIPKYMCTLCNCSFCGYLIGSKKPRWCKKCGR